MLLIDIDASPTCLRLIGPPAPDFLPWCPTQRIVLDPAVIVAYSVLPVTDASTSKLNRRVVYVHIDTIERRYEVSIIVARQEDTGEWAPNATSLMAQLIRALNGYIDVAHDVRTEPSGGAREGQ